MVPTYSISHLFQLLNRMDCLMEMEACALISTGIEDTSRDNIKFETSIRKFYQSRAHISLTFPKSTSTIHKKRPDLFH